ncbi:class I SAM-dependent methyltransferase [Sphingomonas baiyangensis]|uniref:Methyltransferase domain-containing protein n=1 Tax=Sphingomonas baiyangensis TaxID=2572576 RepID=A0A4U1L2L8_9SPHN|nr:methyltransferase domain-containing protein [Sphingomonas baiyangensis]TKD51099.1 methyltransferase domain-containing protein [Sphingomonas baiyangensis]
MTAAADWQNRVGASWAAEWRRTDRSFAGLDVHLEPAVLATLPDAGRVVDIGCGAGTTTLAVAAARPDLGIEGRDVSPALIDVARERGAGMANATFTLGDALAAAPPVAGWFSRHGVMFFADPAAAFARLAQLSAPGAPLVFSCFADRADNHWADALLAELGLAAPGAAGQGLAAGPGPFAFADQAEIAALLRDAGWIDPTARRTAYRYVAGSGPDPVADAADFFGRIGPVAAAIAAAPAAEQAALRTRLHAACAARLHDQAVDFPAAAWLWSARAPSRPKGSAP